MRVDVGIALFRCFYSREAAQQYTHKLLVSRIFQVFGEFQKLLFFFLSVAYLSLIMPFKLSSHILHKLFPNLLLSLTFVLLYFSMDFLALKIGEFLSKAICTCLLNGIKSHTWSFEISKCYFIGFTDSTSFKTSPPTEIFYRSCMGENPVMRRVQTDRECCLQKKTRTRRFLRAT